MGASGRVLKGPSNQSSDRLKQFATSEQPAGSKLAEPRERPCARPSVCLLVHPLGRPHFVCSSRLLHFLCSPTCQDKSSASGSASLFLLPATTNLPHSPPPPRLYLGPRSVKLPRGPPIPFDGLILHVAPTACSLSGRTERLAAAGTCFEFKISSSLLGASEWWPHF